MIGTGELIVILCLIMFLFGGKKLPEFARNLGRGIREFKKACEGEEDVKEPPKVIKEDKTIEVEAEESNPKR
jgi:sec-independent protein translocase protein TatA